jgi:hypothetical protein
MSALRDRGHDIVRCASSSQRTPFSELRSCELLHVYRSADAHTVELMRRCQQLGIAVTWDNDDDVAALEMHSIKSATRSEMNPARDLAAQERALLFADVATTTSRVLANQFLERGARRTTVVENFLPPEFASGTRRTHDGTVVGWVAALEHEADVRLLGLNQIFRGVLEAHPDVRIATVGLNLNLDHPRYNWIEAVPFDRLADVIRTFDIGIAPLADTAFNRSRSNIKVKEYAIAGLPWLASPVGEYATLGARQGGRLVSNDRWGSAIAALVTSRLRRITLALRARTWARGHTIDLQANQWEKALTAAIAARRD